MSLVFPGIAWGTPEDISASPWVDLVTPTVAGSISDPFGGTSAYSIEDSDAGAIEGRGLPVGTAFTAGDWFALFIKENTADKLVAVQIRDTDLGADRYQVRWQFTSGVLAFQSVIAGSGAYVGPIDVGGGWYLIAMRADSYVAGNATTVYLSPAANGTSDTGTTNFYVRKMITLGLVGEVVAYDQPGPGYEEARNDAGVEDAWVPSTVERIDMAVTHIPKGWGGTPYNIGGYDGVSTYASSFRTMLRAGRDKQDLLFIPDLSDCTDYVTSKLADPLTGAPSLSPDGLRQIRLSLRNVGSPYEAYL